MDVHAKVLSILDRARTRHAAGEIDGSAIAAAALRGNALRRRHRHRETRGVVRRKDYREAVAIHGLDRIRAVVADGGTIAAIDLGYDRDAPYVPGAFSEVGIATWTDGRVRTVTLVDEAALHRHPDPTRRILRHPDQGFRPSFHGPDVVAPHAEVWDRAREAYAAADLVLFHSRHADQPRLGLRHDPERVADTECCAWAWFGRKPSLGDLCKAFGIECPGLHNSGNDARYTLDAALAMAADPCVSLLAERRRLRLEWEAALHRLIMHPVRAPGVELLQAAAGEAHRRLASTPLPAAGLAGDASAA